MALQRGALTTQARRGENMPVDVLVPPLGTNVDVLTLISWYKQEGETVVKDEPLFVVETDKATLDVEAPASGVLFRVFAGPGEQVAALSRIASILSADEADRVDAVSGPTVSSLSDFGRAEPSRAHSPVRQTTPTPEFPTSLTRTSL